ncbi:hypothetical protein Z517_09171 [Fonsecaea pedrosoi CBS 271.37]|uniref:Lysine-specific metallo-endopeptidase domain-containing protein n=1 Tax=Fonsecaea pedrosoi CBS 271.37 TaxID=1442368 RepID=A0A0D2ER32_9EURO|nr:uncharacterized protein Z517_09171 [Fonsecaea pedrosoi CBS 271.37]KIW76727.1 hypothetical protein Z517_09171 [Fonsecaea pedrosoi CBS 271.37]
MASHLLLSLAIALFTLPMLGIQLEAALVNIPPEIAYRMQVAVDDCVALATFVSVTFDECDPVYLRFFPHDDAAFVQQVFRRIANIPPNVVLGPSDFATIMQHRAAIGLDPRLVDLVITYGNHPQGQIQDCGTDEDPEAFFALLNSGQPSVSICPQAFERYPDLMEILDPPAWARDAQGHPDPGFGCDGLGDQDSELMWCVGAILLHEILHYPDLFNDIPQFDKLINFRGPRRSIGDFSGPSPPNGYGPYYSRVLQFLSAVRPGDYGPHEAINNADSYATYALSVWWRWRCQRPFRESVTSMDAWLRDPPPRPFPPPPPLQQ